MLGIENYEVRLVGNMYALLKNMLFGVNVFDYVYVLTNVPVDSNFHIYIYTLRNIPQRYPFNKSGVSPAFVS